MKVSELLQRLRELGVKLWVEGTELKVSAPKGALDAELKQELVRSKPELIALLGPAGRDAAPTIARWSPAIVEADSLDPTLRPMSFTQKRVWFLDQLEPGLIAYNMWISLVLRGPLDVEAFERSLHEILGRHEVLRSSFPARDGVPGQLVHEPEWIRLEHVAAPEGLSEAAWREQIHGTLTERVELAFDLAHEPLFQPTLFRIREDEHLFFARIHHIVYDGLSNGVLVRELTELYEAFASGKPSPLPELAIQYSDYAAWQARRFDGEYLERQLDWWRETLSGELPILELPLDRPRPKVQTHVGANHRHQLPAALFAAVERYAATHGTTVFPVLLAAYQALLVRLSGQEDVCVGTAAANRGRSELETLIGYFVNTLVVRVDASGDPSFDELVRRSEASFLGAWEHQEVPFERLVDELAPERTLSTSPLFQTLFVLNQDTGAERRMGNLELEHYTLEIPMSRADLVATIYRLREGTYLDLEYNTDLFDVDTVARIAATFERLLRDAMEDPARGLSQLRLLSEEEREELLHALNATEASFPHTTVHAQFEARVDETPNAPALLVPADRQDGDRSGGDASENGKPVADLQWSYAELDARANRLAHHLRARGVRSGELVGLCLERSADMLAALLAILKCGAAYVPLDPGFPPDRLAYMAKDAGLTHVVTESALFEVCPRTLERIVLDREHERIAACSSARLELPAGERASEDSRMYVIYTSGSTGKPKGVELMHKSVSNFLASMRVQPGLASPETLLAITTLSFDISVLELFLPLTSGARVALAPRAVTTDGDRLCALIDRLRPQVIQATPATWRMLLLAGWKGYRELRVFCGGEALTRELADGLCRRSSELWNLYGPTEATVWSTVERVHDDGAPITIGQPIANTRIYVLDRHQNPVPRGVTGELWIAGEGLAKGYLGREQLTAERFVPDPFLESPANGAETRMYATGDLGRRLVSGKLECLGRIDSQIKLRGYRIELGEIEAVLNAAPGVHDCAVIVREDRPGAQRLTAYWVAEQDHTTTVEELDRQLGRQLPSYMVPASYVNLEELPLTPNGKVDRRALRSLRPRAEDRREAYVGPRNGVEERLALLFATVLGEERVGVHDSFFELGGNSLLSTQVMARLRQDFEVELPLRALFEEPTVAGLAQRVDSARRSTQEPIPVADRSQPLPLAFPQERLWFLDQLEPGLIAYNMWPACTLHGTLDVDALARALGEIVRRHEVLRTRFQELAQGPVQVVDPPGEVALEVWRDEEGLGAAAWRARVRTRLAERVRRPFDLARGPLFQPLLVRIDEQEHQLVLLTHHVIFDGWSIGILFRELAALLPAFAAGRPSPLSELELQYADFATWQRETFAGEAYERLLAYWKETLAGDLPVLEIPTDRPRPRLQTYDGGTRTRSLPVQAIEGLEQLARAEGATLFMALLAVYDTLLLRTTGQTDLCVGTAVANRERAELESLIGFFVNTLVLRTDASGSPTFRELLRRVKDSALGAFEHQDMPFERLVDELSPERNLSYTPIFQTLFVLDEDTGEERAMGALRLEPLELEGRVARTDLTLWGYRSRDGFELLAEYNTDLFDPETIDRLLEHYEVLLADAVRVPDERITRMALLSERERQRLVVEWNDTRSDYARGSSIPAVFEARVAETPDAVAAVFVAPEAPGSPERALSLSYAELNRRANQLAHHLRALGVGPDALVGLCTERSLPMLVSILAILKAGGAYVPLDPGYPEERLAFMIEDAGLSILLAQEDFVDVLPPIAGELVLVDDAARFATESAENLPLETTDRDLAYVMFTSGSTGRPKGVCVEHRSVLRLVCEPNFCSLGPEEVLLHFAPISFDASTLEVWGALLRGGRMVVYPPTAPSLDELAAVLRGHGVTTAWLTAGLFSLMVDQELEGLSGLRQLLAGGDVLPVPQVNRVLTELADVRLINGYGPTENTTFTCCHQISDGGPLQGSVPIGRPVSDTRVYVQDENGELVPIGIPGELMIGGDGLARGYLKRPGLTAERFVPDPLHPGERLYRTGDVVRWRPDGTLEFLGRRDNQVKVRGFRIELGEIESVLGTLPGIRECVVVVREDQPGDKRIVGYVVAQAADKSAEPDLSAVRRRLERRLPGYMVPAHLVALDALPLSPNGKVAREALPAPEGERSVLESEFVPPRDEVEERIAGIWAEVLGTERVGIHDNFFELGGNSLLTTKAMAELRRAFSVELPLRELFEEPTVAGLAGRIRGDEESELARKRYEETFDESLIPLQSKGWKPPLFLVSGAHANEDAFLRFVGALLPHMGPEQPIYGFKARGLDGIQTPHKSAEEMAADYIREMCKHYPEGPYLLAGNCVGGIVAFEMARQLEAQGRDVALVALLDTVRPQESYREYVDHHFRFWKTDRFVAHVRALGALSFGEKIGYFWSRAKRKVLSIPFTEGIRRANHIRSVERTYGRILARYEPEPFGGKITVILNQELEDYMHAAGWEGFAAELDLQVVPGDHITRLSVNAGRVADVLRKCIDKAAQTKRRTA